MFLCWLILVLMDSVVGIGEPIRLLGVHVPSQQMLNSDVLLECLYELHPASPLYAIKWYKDGYEFYRYLPADVPPAQTFSLPGVAVRMTQSNQHQVMLESVQLNSTGVYLCEVSTEAPFFHTVSGQGTLTVIAPRLNQVPHISGLRGLYKEGNVVETNCSSPPSKTVVDITWYVNGRQAQTDWLLHFGVTVDESTRLSLAILGLRLKATQDTFPNRVLKLKCVAQLGTQQQEQNRWTFLINKQKSNHGIQCAFKRGAIQHGIWLLLTMGTFLYIIA